MDKDGFDSEEFELEAVERFDKLKSFVDVSSLGIANDMAIIYMKQPNSHVEHYIHSIFEDLNHVIKYMGQVSAEPAKLTNPYEWRAALKKEIIYGVACVEQNKKNTEQGFFACGTALLGASNEIDALIKSAFNHGGYNVGQTLCDIIAEIKERQ